MNSLQAFTLRLPLQTLWTSFCEPFFSASSSALLNWLGINQVSRLCLILVYHCWCLKLMVKGLKSRTPAKVSKVPATLGHLNRLFAATDRSLSRWASSRFKAMTSLSFFGFLRPSEYCVSPQNYHLRIKDLRFSSNSSDYTLYFHAFKHSSAPASVRISDSMSKAFLPVSCLKKYVKSLSKNSLFYLISVV